jgi:hypothetical protein
LIGTSTDGGQRLQVQGDAFIRGSGATSATTALLVQNSAGTQQYIFNNAGQAMFGINVPSGGTVKLETDGVFRAWTQIEVGQFGNVAINTTSLSKTASGSDFFQFTNAASHTATSGTYYFLQLRNTVAPTSGTGVFNNLNLNITINQTGGANGITRGLYVNPTLTAAADWRSIEWSNNSGWGLYGAGTADNYLAGKLVIGTTSVSTFALDVNGTARVSGYALFGSGNSGTPLATLADFRGGSDTDFIQVARASTSSDRYVRMYANGQIDALSTKTDSAPFTFAAAANANTTGNRGLFSLTNTFNPTSGTATYTTFTITQTINQTGGANGITRGLYINPTLTAAADWRAIEVSAGVSVLAPSTTSSATLRIPSGTAPTSPVNGDIWFDGTDLKMRIGGVTKTFTLV